MKKELMASMLYKVQQLQRTSFGIANLHIDTYIDDNGEAFFVASIKHSNGDYEAIGFYPCNDEKELSDRYNKVAKFLKEIGAI